MKTDRIQLNHFASLQYLDPHKVLRRLRALEIGLANVSIDEPVRRLRTNGLKSAHEMRLAALFCAGMSSLAGQRICFAGAEAQDYDFVAKWRSVQTEVFCEVQLKEVAPKDQNREASFDDVFRSLRRYADPEHLVVAVSLSQNTRFNPAALELPEDLVVGEFWVFGALEPDHSKWGLWGDFTKGSVRQGHVFDYPGV